MDPLDHLVTTTDPLGHTTTFEYNAGPGRFSCAKFGCVYLHAVGGAAQVLAEFVTMDAHGNSLHATVLEQSKERMKQLL